MVPYNGPIEHIFFHPLLAYPSLTFDGDVDSNGFNQYFVTVSEFEKIDGIALYNQGTILKNFFDAKSVLDPVRPPLKAGS